MKKLLAISILFVACIFFSGCSHTTFSHFNQNSLLTKLHKSGFSPELPTELPFKVKSTHITEAPQPNNKIYTVDFHGTNGEYLYLQMINGGNVKYSDHLKWEKVQLGNYKGSYVKNKAGAMMLNWDHKNIHYDMTYYTKQSKRKISKIELIKTAESFK